MIRSRRTRAAHAHGTNTDSLDSLLRLEQAAGVTADGLPAQRGVDANAIARKDRCNRNARPVCTEHGLHPRDERSDRKPNASPERCRDDRNAIRVLPARRRRSSQAGRTSVRAAPRSRSHQQPQAYRTAASARGCREWPLHEVRSWTFALAGSRLPGAACPVLLPVWHAEVQVGRCL
jgi:hypothetical protein